jgi:excinuclease ABC subunit B
VQRETSTEETIMYADSYFKHAKKTINETNYRRTKQINFNTANNQVPRTLNKKNEMLLPESFGGFRIRLRHFSASGIIRNTYRNLKSKKNDSEKRKQWKAAKNSILCKRQNSVDTIKAAGENLKAE